MPKLTQTADKNVTKTNDANVTSAIRFLQVWRYDVCPSWARVHLTPYTVDVIPDAAYVAAHRAFDAKTPTGRRSADRNALERETRNRNLNWLLKM